MEEEDGITLLLVAVSVSVVSLFYFCHSASGSQHDDSEDKDAVTPSQAKRRKVINR